MRRKSKLMIKGLSEMEADTSNALIEQFGKVPFFHPVERLKKWYYKKVASGAYKKAQDYPKGSFERGTLEKAYKRAFGKSMEAYLKSRDIAVPATITLEEIKEKIERFGCKKKKKMKTVQDA